MRHHVRLVYNHWLRIVWTITAFQITYQPGRTALHCNPTFETMNNFMLKSTIQKKKREQAVMEGDFNPGHLFATGVLDIVAKKNRCQL